MGSAVPVAASVPAAGELRAGGAAAGRTQPEPAGLPHGRARANEARNKLRWTCHELFKEIDVLLMPVVPVTAFVHQTGGNQFTRRILVDGKKRPYMDHIPWAALATVAYLPATSAPVGISADGLPVNIQIVGPHLGDYTTIRFAELLAEVRGGFQCPPGYRH